MLTNDVQTPEGHLTAFSGGATGTGLNTATSLQDNVDPDFHPASVLSLPNMIQTPNGMSDQTYAQTLPMQNMMRNQLGAGE